MPGFHARQLSWVEALEPAADTHEPARQWLTVFPVNHFLWRADRCKYRREGDSRIAAAHDDERPAEEGLRVVYRIWMPKIVLTVTVESKDQPERVGLRMIFAIEAKQAWDVPTEAGENGFLTIRLAKLLPNQVKFAD